MSRSHIGKNHLKPDTKVNSEWLLVADVSDHDSRQPTYIIKDKDRLADSLWFGFVGFFFSSLSRSSVCLQDPQVFRKNCCTATIHLSSLFISDI